MAGAGRNDPCPCGSGKKYKRCCLSRLEARTGFTAEERASALGKLEGFLEEELGREDDAAWEEFYGHWDDRDEELDADWRTLSENAFDMWVAFDRRLSGGRRAVDLFLEEGPPLTPGERRCLEQLRDTPVRLYEVVDLSPGVSLTLLDVEAGVSVTVHERTASRSLRRSALLAVRVVGCGASGRPEMERGVLAIPPLVRASLLSQVAEVRERFRHEQPEGDAKDLDAQLAPLFHDTWMRCTLEPPIPRLQTTDGEEMLFTRLRFEVGDAARLEAALDSHEELERDVEARPVWLWSGRNQQGEPTLLGRIELSGGSLRLDCHSAQRGNRGRALLEALAGDCLRHTLTTHENPAAQLRERLRAGGADEPDGEAATGLPREQQEALTLEYLGRHYREWIDIPVPALEQRTPRDAAGDPALRPRLAELIRELEGSYEAALREAAPAYDPSWMWDELGFEGRTDPARPPPPAHERLASMSPGLGELCRSVSAQVRGRAGFDDTQTVLTASDLADDMDVRRFLKRRAGAAGAPRRDDPAAAPETGSIDQLLCLANFELHRCKTFWVDEALAYMLAKTDVDVPGAQVRAPFPCFALVFTDRHLLSLAERMVSGDAGCPVAGQMLRVVTVYATEESGVAGRSLRLGIALDALGADPPHMVPYEIPLVDDAGIERFLDGVAPRVVSDPPVPDASPLRGLLRGVLNAILYASSAGVEAEVREAARRPRGGPLPFAPDRVYFLPGAIEISKVRLMQELERVPSGRGLLHRFMVRGHWRRPAPSWKDQRLRWIAPYWKGPDLAAIIERTYRLQP